MSNVLMRTGCNTDVLSALSTVGLIVRLPKTSSELAHVWLLHLFYVHDVCFILIQCPQTPNRRSAGQGWLSKQMAVARSPEPQYHRIRVQRSRGIVYCELQA